MIRILAISGSVRAASTNTALLRAAAKAAPEGVTVTVYEGLGSLPIFNPDHTEALPPAVAELRRLVLAADGFLLSSPEYAHGVPGGIKNALDWIVGWGEIANRPVALFNTSPYGEHAKAALAEILVTMSLRIVPDASLTLHLRGNKPEEAAPKLTTAEVRESLRRALVTFAGAIRRYQAEAHT
ncbi:MAG TPA: NADPH-dependent FMN reductase [Gammaproteobacteria bacterium]|nr:NADPH-dependent FMN reductase [Gammaproteobacteria bacterium]